MATIVFVHGTGVRLKAYKKSVQRAAETAKAEGIDRTIVECAWGDPLGAVFEGLSIPDGPHLNKAAEQAADDLEWNWLFQDPMFQLERLATRERPHDELLMPGTLAEWETRFNELATYEPSEELLSLLQRAGLEKIWPQVWANVMKDPADLPRRAFEASPQELPDAARALARALVAQLHVDAVASSLPGPGRTIRQRMVERLYEDFQANVLGLGTFFVDWGKRIGTNIVKKGRSSLSFSSAFMVGDVLIYQANGAKVRNFIQQAVEKAKPPVCIVAHSLGGIACVDLLAMRKLPEVDRFVTVGSQAPLLYELGALVSMQPPAALPDHFPRWLNLYDRSDFLSYVAEPCWPAQAKEGRVRDHEIDSGEPFPDSHSAYISEPKTWQAIGEFLK